MQESLFGKYNETMITKSMRGDPSKLFPTITVLGNNILSRKERKLQSRLVGHLSICEKYLLIVSLSDPIRSWIVQSQPLPDDSACY